MRRVLFDENMPRKLRRDLVGFFVRTVQEEGWAGLDNGRLLGRASESFDVLLTADQRLRHQQNIARFSVGVVVIATVDTTIANLRRYLTEIRAALASVTPGAIVVVDVR